MSQSLSKIWTHLIFSTKDRYPFLPEPNFRTETHAYLASILKAHNCPTLIVGGVADHIHARKYIERQEHHHRRRTFEDEFREFLGRYNIDYDERYLWD